MNKIKVSLMCCRLNFLKWHRSPRVISVMLIMLTMFGFQLSSLRDSAQHYGTAANAGAFGLLFFPIMILVYTFLVIVMFCDAPFMDRQAMNVLIRSGRPTWIAGQMMYIVAASLVMAVFGYIAAVLALLPYVDFSNTWTDLMAQYARGNIVAALDSLPRSVIKKYTPISYSAICLLLNWLVTVFLASVMLFFNLHIRSGAGIIAVAVLAVYSYYITIFPPFDSALLLSPVSWYSFYLARDHLPYVFTFLAVGSALLMLLSGREFTTIDLYSSKRGRME